MKKLISMIIVFFMFIFSCSSNYICKYEIEKNLNKEIEKIESNIKAAESFSNEKNKIQVEVLNISKLLAEYKLNNYKLSYIDDAISEIRSVKCVILKNKLESIGYDENLINECVNSYIENKVYDSKSLYNIETYSKYINDILKAVKNANMDEYEQVKTNMYKDLSENIEKAKKELKKDYDESQDFAYIEEIQNLVDKKILLETVDIKITSYADVQIKYIVFNILVSIIVSIIFVKLNRPRKDRSKLRNTRKKITQRRIRLQEEKNGKIKNINIGIAIVLIMLNNIISIYNIIIK